MVYNIFFSPGNNKQPSINDIPKGNPKTNEISNRNKKIAVIACGTLLLGLGACCKEILFKAMPLATNNQTSLTNSSNSTQSIINLVNPPIMQKNFPEWINSSKTDLEYECGCELNSSNNQNINDMSKSTASNNTSNSTFFNKISNSTSSNNTSNFTASNDTSLTTPTAPTKGQVVQSILQELNFNTVDCSFQNFYPSETTIDNAFSELERLDWWGYYYGLIFKHSKKCIGKEDPASQSMVKNGFSRLSAFAPELATEIYAYNCMDKEDPLCQGIVENSYNNLLKCINNTHPPCNYVRPLHLELFESKCIGKASATCQRISQEQFSQWLESPKLSHAYALSEVHCIEKVNPFCRTIFYQFLQKDPNLAAEYAIKCIGKSDEISQKVVKNAYSFLLKSDPTSAFKFAKACMGNEGEFYQDVVKQAFSDAIRLKHPMDVCDIARKCIGKTDVVSTFVIENALQELLNLDLTEAQFFIRDCVGRNDPIYQSIVEDGLFEMIKRGERLFIIIKAFKEIDSYQSLIQKAFSRLSKEDIPNATKSAGYCKNLECPFYQLVIMQALKLYE